MSVAMRGKGKKIDKWKGKPPLAHIDEKRNKR
jgi:hypothetical protein